MDKIRKIEKVIKNKPIVEGAGVHLKRVFGFREAPQFDPFLLLDDFRGDDERFFIKGFPWHPHRGIETITYMLDGFVEHSDSLGNSGIIEPGDVQWMTAGSGIIHQEMPKPDAFGKMGGFQLWANLPAKHKMMNPRYRDIKGDEIPEVRMKGDVNIKVICGKIDEISGPARDIVIDPVYLDISVPPDTEYFHPTKLDHNVFAYVIGGSAIFCSEDSPFTHATETDNYVNLDRDPMIRNGTILLFGEGEQISVKTRSDSVRFLFVSGKPLREPIAWYGPIVMNTQQELKIAFDEFDRGTFIKNKRE
jgi:redox-sensitive bicupin YhaK (pirin superfamily)